MTLIDRQHKFTWMEHVRVCVCFLEFEHIGEKTAFHLVSFLSLFHLSICRAYNESRTFHFSGEIISLVC